MDRFKECLINSDSRLHNLPSLQCVAFSPLCYESFNHYFCMSLPQRALNTCLLWVCWYGRLPQVWLLMSAFFFPLNLLNQNFSASWYILHDLSSIIPQYKRYKIKEATSLEKCITFWSKCLWICCRRERRKRRTDYSMQGTKKINQYVETCTHTYRYIHTIYLRFWSFKFLNDWSPSYSNHH